ncbi:MAG: hypothetical protein IPM82_12435 [Saprospiraceae bacterium]|nr:hypothetical protein [Saprospiraceae bacterium]
MSRKDLINRIELLKKQLTLMLIEQDDFLKRVSQKELEAWKDEILDELKEKLDLLEKYDAKN